MKIKIALPCKTISTPVASKCLSRKFASIPVVKKETNKATLPME